MIEWGKAAALVFFFILFANGVSIGTMLALGIILTLLFLALNEMVVNP